ncbi:hypothetical protein EDB81DRAFT_465225 [Dactylonectria macrodidyma]|uniref:4-coumarate-CoA ligase n=1 Tax=Dactylonectria macrodidyma TaxID=307937 RepID=A0A9P9J9U9_9HYPO|nr:hypothetical protein EDB81DRAFT_465225 [Dactylonectria macrodidyma]
MPIKSRFSVPVPNCSIQQWVFGSPSGPLPDKKAWIDADRPETHFLTYTQGRLLAKRIAVGLIEDGVKPGDRVLLYSGNSIFFPAIAMGVWMAGAVFTGANHGYVARELAFQLKDSGACLMIAVESNFEAALEAASLVGMKHDRVFMFDSTLPDSAQVEKQPQGDSRHWTELIASETKGDEFVWVEPEDSKTVTCGLNYSSGTTGVPKGVEISHYNHVANGIGAIHFDKLDPEYENKNNRAAALCFLPMSHAFSMGYFINYLPHEGVPVYVMPSFNFPKMLAHIEAFRITKLFTAPPILVLLTKHPLARRADLSSIEMVACGAAPLSKETQREVNSMLPRSGSFAKQGWGMTEATCVAFSWDPTRSSNASVGELVANCQAKLVHLETGVEITKAKTPGELWLTGPTIMRGYWRNAAATNEVFVIDGDGTRWLRTGDVAYVEEFASGTLFHIVDRVKELIKVKGLQVAPAELEALLLERDDVADAAVIGVTINGEEVPRGYIVKTPNAKDTTEDDIASWLAARVARHKWLVGGVVFIDAIPKIPSGKILRKTLRERAKREVCQGGEVRPKL